MVNKIVKFGNLNGYTGGSWGGNVFSRYGISPTIVACRTGYNGPLVIDVNDRKYQCREISFREAGRLMDVSDEDIDKMAAVNSKTQLYKQFGNSIVVSVMCAMFEQLGLDKIEEEPRVDVVLYGESDGAI